MHHEKDAEILKKWAQNIIRENHPSTVGQLAHAIKAARIVDDDELVSVIREMVHEGSLKLAKPDYSHETLIDYFLTPTLSTWFWVTCLVTGVTILVLRVAPNLPALEILRWTLGSVFVLYAPGYALIRFLLPNISEMDSVEKYTLNVVASLTVTALVGVLLEYTQIGINLPSVTSSIAIFVLFFITAAAIRDHQRIRTPGA
jgi:hypothetical protein